MSVRTTMRKESPAGQGAAGFGLIALKLVFLLALFFFTGPVVTHALAQACLHAGIRPMLAEDRREARRLPVASGDDGRRP